jgi:hypothetical protein
MRCRRSLILAAVTATAAFALFAAGCGGAGSPEVANVATSTTGTRTTMQNGAVAFTRCMRSDGVPNFPDPPRIGAQAPKLTLQQLGVSDSKLQAAKRVCDHLLPNGGSEPQETVQQTRARLANALSFARCMRRHGVARFPDPTAQGDLSVEMVKAQGIDVRSPAVLRVVQACLPASHGALTPAKVRAALDNAGG